MRLRLMIKRHNLPETPIIWVVDTATSPTVAELLVQVNDAIPIEAGEWGFEDYAVEVKGNNGVNYECLHYQPVSKVLKEEDEVIIRPLLTQDVRVRRTSGRVQISSDGKRLYDGLAFGRPLLRRPADRPAIHIPPLKKRRITYHGDENADGGFAEWEDMAESDSGNDNKKQLVLHADFDDDSEEDDDDFAPGGEEDADGDEESEEEDVKEGNENGNEEDEEEQKSVSQPIDDEAPESTADQLALAHVPDLATRAKIRKLHSAFPISALAVCKYILIGTEGDMGEAYEALNRGFVAVKSKSAITEISQELENISVPETRSKAKKTLTKEPGDAVSMEVDTEESQGPLVNYYDQNGFPPGSIISGMLTSVAPEATKSSLSRPESKRSNSAASNKTVRFAVTEDLANGLTSTPFIDQESHEDDESEESNEDSSEEDDGTSSSGSSDSSEGGTPQIVEASSSSSSESDTDSSSDLSSDDEAPKETSSKPAHVKATNHRTAPSTLLKTDQQLKNIEGKPGQGKTSTQARNQRRRQNTAMTRWKAKGILPESTTIHEFIRMGNLNGITSKEEGLAVLQRVRAAINSDDGSELVNRAHTKSGEFELRRQELLSSLSSGGIEVGQESFRQTPPMTAQSPVVASSAAEVNTSSVVRSQSIENPTASASEIQHSGSVTKDLEISAQSEDVRSSIAPEASVLETPVAFPQQLTASAESTQAGPSRRAKLDLGAGRRLLFGALGIKTPKTKTDEEKVRSDLMKYVRPLKAIDANKDKAENSDEEATDDDPDAWREKIVYRAVECVQDDIELSEPPFPFVQRWDPQQQNQWSQKGNRGGKRKQSQRDQVQYYNDDSQASKKQKQRKGKHNYAEEQEYLNASYEPSYQADSIVPDYEDPSHLTRLQSDNVEGEINQQLLNNASGEPDDLAPLPKDPASLPTLQEGQSKVGMTIAFKLLDCSAATKWQPQMTAYRTAIVIATPDSGELNLTLAMRDRKQHKFDNETGERIYDKFDMPDADDEMEEQDDGMLNLRFSELYGPKIVQDAPANLNEDIVRDEPSRSNGGASLTNSVTLSHEEEAQFSHVTKTPLQSDAPEPEQQSENAVNFADQIAEKALEKIAEVAKEVMQDIEEEFHEAPRHPIVEENVMDKAAETLGNEETLEPTTPSVHAGKVTPETISEETRQNISHMIKDAGFRSSISSSIIKDIRPDGMESPGDAAVFEKLMRDMTGTGSNTPYSPKFKGLGASSPPRKCETPPVPAESDFERSKSPVAVQSSWIIMDAENEVPSSPPKETEPLNTSSWVTDPEDQPSSPPIGRPSERNSIRKAPPKRVPVGKAQAMWEQLQPPTRRGSTKSPVESGKTSPDLGLGLDGADERDMTQTEQYSKLSVGSSFTSQITDHGRQPDFYFDDGAAFNAGSPLVPELEVDTPVEAALKTDDGETDLSSRSLPNKNVEDNQIDNSIESQLLPQKSPISSRIEASMRSPAKEVPEPRQESPPSSDDPFPALEEVFSLRSVKPERTTPIPQVKPSKEDREYKKAMAKVDEDSEDSGQSTPKASQQKRNRNSHSHSTKSKIPKIPESRTIKRRTSQQPASQSRKPQPSQPRPFQSQASQFVDLTLSSDAEPEPEPQPAAVGSDASQPSRAFRRDNPDAEDDEDYEDKGGWVEKNKSTITGVGSRRKTGNGLKDSSQTSLNMHHRRKTIPRF